MVARMDAFERSLQHGAHALLEAMTGAWRGRARLWLVPGALHGEAPVSGEVVTVLGGRFVRHDYSTTIDQVQHGGTALLGMELSQRAWQVAWADTFHMGTGIMLSEGPFTRGEAAISVLGSYDAGDGAPWGWRTTFEPAGHRLLVRHFNITPEGDEALAVELDYRRA